MALTKSEKIKSFLLLNAGTNERQHVGQKRPKGRIGAQEAAPSSDQRGEEEEGGGEEEEGGKEESE